MGSVPANGMNISRRERERDKLFPIEHKDLLNLFYQMEVAIGNTQKPRENEWSYIPFSHGEFINFLVKYPTPKKYIEIGCGIGTKLWLVKQILQFEDVSGVEINEQYLQVAKNLLEGVTLKCNLILGDAWELDYSEYDMIYSYDPMNGSGGRNKFFEKVQNQMKKGAILLHAHCFAPEGSSNRIVEFVK